MSGKLSRRSGAVDPFIVMDVMAAAAEKEAGGDTVIHLEVGQPSTPAPKGALAAARASHANARTTAERARSLAPLWRSTEVRAYAGVLGASVALITAQPGGRCAPLADTVLLLPAVAPPDDVGRRVRWIGWLASLFFLAALLKITVLQIAWAWVLVLQLVQPGRGWGRLLVHASLWCLAALVVVAWVAGGASGYWSALSGLSEVRWSVLEQEWRRYVGFLIFSQRVPLSLLLMAACRPYRALRGTAQGASR